MPAPLPNASDAPNTYKARPRDKASLPTGITKKLLRYRFLKKLGSGGFGDVWLAQTNLNGDKRALVAVKVVRRSSVGRSTFAMEEEQRLLELFTVHDPGHGYFPHLIESFIDGHNFYLVQEYIPGGTLRDEMKRNGGFLSLQRAKFVLAQLLTILLVMREAGVVHRDIKPENILIDAGGNVVLADLGLASDLAESRNGPLGRPNIARGFRYTEANCGTIGYVAPEIWLRQKHRFSVDLYACGIIFFEMVFGIHPFPQRNVADMLDAMIDHQFSAPLDLLPYEAANLMFRLLISRPEARLTLTEAIDHPFFLDVDMIRVWGRKYDLPSEWSPPLAHVYRRHTVNLRVLVDKRARKPSGKKINRSVENAFTMPQRSPTVKRPVPKHISLKCQRQRTHSRRKHVNALRNACARRTASPPEPICAIDLPNVVKSRQQVHSLEEGKIIEHSSGSARDYQPDADLNPEMGAYTIIQQRSCLISQTRRNLSRLALPNPQMTPSIVVTDEKSPVGFESKFSIGFSDFNSLPLDEVLLSPIDYSSDTLALGIQTPEPSPDLDEPIEELCIAPCLLTAPANSPPVTPSPITPTVGASIDLNGGIVVINAPTICIPSELGVLMDVEVVSIPMPPQSTAQKWIAAETRFDREEAIGLNCGSMGDPSTEGVRMMEEIGMAGRPPARPFYF